ncbi:lysozyme inhibitor LprI family protein [Oceanobacillus sp. FSL H7-0719]|uniref:lysozyme inhibitor LprI family protein n=1 Tax=Oceanobacillus sp. FSL H7-0719 TaxID=2954507 RepID=UPI0032536B86
MKKRKTLIAATLLLILLVAMSACSNSTDDKSNNDQTEPESIPEETEDAAQTTDSPSKKASNTDNSDDTLSEEATAETEENELEEDKTADTVTKIEGRRTEFIERLDNIQKELDALPEKKDSDKGVTNAMKNYYGRSYEMYDKELNEIYALLKENLSPEIMNELKTEQMKWIEQKEKTAEEERLKYNGGTFENVALYISLYESTKERCYELVNEYMTD